MAKNPLVDRTMVSELLQDFKTMDQGNKSALVSMFIFNVSQYEKLWNAEMFDHCKTMEVPYHSTKLFLRIIKIYKIYHDVKESSN